MSKKKTNVLQTEVPDYQTYQSPEWSENYRTQVANGEGAKYYDTATEQYKEMAEKNRATQLGDAQKQQQSALKQAYVNRVQNQQKLNKNLAMSGIRGGATETSNLRLANQYGAERGMANTDYANSVNTINQNIDQNIFDYQSDMASRKEEYIQNQANAMWQADREDSLNEYNAQNEFWNNYYLDYYSGVKKGKLNKLLKKAQQGYKNATTPEEKLKYLQEIRGIQNRRGVIRNK